MIFRSSVSDTRTAVMALGSGLGVALITNNSNNERHVLPCELGHVQIPTVWYNDQNSKLEYELMNHVSNHYYNGKQMPEFEDVSSGRRIKMCYQFFIKYNNGVLKSTDNIDPGKVVVDAKNGDKTARDALFWCYKMLIRLAKQIGTSLQCNSIILALDNQVKNASFVDSISDQLKDDWMNGIRVYSQIKKLNFNILGSDYVANKKAQKSHK